MPAPVDPNGLTLTFASGGSITIGPDLKGTGVTISFQGAPGYLPNTGITDATLTEATAVYTLLGHVITNITP